MPANGMRRAGVNDHAGTGTPSDRIGTSADLSYNVLHKFTGVPDGTNPFGGLVLDAQGNLYGTTWFGGDPACSCGVVFKVDTSGKETILYSFTGIRADGRPWGNLAMDAQGNLYGATYSSWTIFEVDTNGNETVLYTFTGGADGGGRPEA